MDTNSSSSCTASFLKRTNPGSEGPKSDWKVLFFIVIFVAVKSV